MLIRCYHGLGDTLQFIRYVPLLRPVAREILVWAQPRLLPILATLSGIDRLLPLHDGTPGVSYDVDVEVMELPYVFRTTLATIPRRVPYLTAAPRPLDGPAPRVGIVWRGGGWDAARAFPFDLVAALVEAVPATWYQLQHPVASDERHPKLRPLPCDSIEGTAACMMSLDLVITVDTMAAHLAGALGVPVWTLLGSEPDWRWMRARADSPWYPSMRLFRQTSAGDWTSVATAVVEALVRARVRGVTVFDRPAIHL